MKTFKINGEFITLGQFVKAAGLVSSGGMVKPFLEDNKIFYNGTLENRRGKKIYPNDKVQIGKDVYTFTHD
ncbi:MAG: S4 domain-containing protein YaaA [Tenericutes bacterium HGW-Tenericutes-8]|nr:MAG: S4 domain-containing protein YaaA [Tenericutes bacterium HGW-Tenericutes-8]